MQENKLGESSYYKSKIASLSSLLIFILVVLVGFFIANFLGFVATLPFMDYDLEIMTKLMENPSNFPETRIAFLVMQGVTAFCIFILTSLIYLRFVDNTSLVKKLFISSNLSTVLLLLFVTVALTIIEMPLIGWLGEWNQGWVFPENFQNWAKAHEERMKELTIFITEFHTFEQFVLGFVVIAIIPGIGEELLFRGLLQNKLKDLFGNAHIAIWVSAIIFSAIHFQFYGFAPRMLLGAIFGYLYYWSGNLTYAMLAHFINNGFTVLMMYLYQQQQIEIDIEKEQIPLDMASMSLIIVSILLFLFYKIAQNVHITNINEVKS
ncbi:MAG: CPBP family intramembrane metalloprotease [Cytophagales bacterium]|nr:MAG: CPBP family intramembrane metalloprotease [Cytophagales bacterium]